MSKRGSCKDLGNGWHACKMPDYAGNETISRAPNPLLPLVRELRDAMIERALKEISELLTDPPSVELILRRDDIQRFVIDMRTRADEVLCQAEAGAPDKERHEQG
jgi:hypothetical protein